MRKRRRAERRFAGRSAVELAKATAVHRNDMGGDFHEHVVRMLWS